jgi:hypothetical protein
MVDFTTTDGAEVTNHKWVTESELSPTKKWLKMFFTVRAYPYKG